MHDDDLQLLLARPGGAPVLADGLGADEAGQTDTTPPLPDPDYLWEEGDDPNRLDSQRWGVLAPQGPLGDRLLALIQPLVDHRHAQQRAPVEVYRVPPRLGPADALRWRKREFEAGGGLRTDLPRFLLLLGDLDCMPLAVQHAFAADAFPGRLAFPAESDYSAYVEKVLSWESSPPIARAGTLLCGVRDGSSATELGHRALLEPGLELLRESCRNGHLDATLAALDLGDKPTADPLLAAAAAARSGVLFTLGHGEGPPRGGWTDPALRRARQGAMCFGREPPLTGADLRARPFMPGGVWCNLSCYGAGTPDRSAFHHWLRALADAGRYFGRPEAVLDALPKNDEPPFVAALPQAALASPDGPLAFVGHVDLAWTYGFQELDDRTVTRPGRLMALVRSLLRGDRAGVALREVARGVGMANAELTCLFDQDESLSSAPGPSEQARRAHLWLLRQDLAAYVLLGDPAVRLPLARTPDPDPDWRRELAEVIPPELSTPTPHTRPPEPAAPTIDPAVLARHEQLIIRHLAGENLNDLAADAEMSRADLQAAVGAYQGAARSALAAHLAARSPR